MASWWRIYCETHGLINSVARGSWKKRAAYGFSAQDQNGNSWPKKLCTLVQSAGSPGLGPLSGSATRKLPDEDANLESSAARMLALYGGRAPMT
jgi:hypothetical protein